MKNTTVTEAHYALRREVIFSAPDEGAQLIASSEAKAVVEIAMVAAESADRNVSLRLERDQLRAELATCKDASEALVESLRAEIKSCGELSCDECNARTAALIAERDQLRAIFPQICEALGNGSCCAPDVSLDFLQSIPNEVAGVVANLRAEVDAQCLLNAKGSEREAVLLGRVDRMAKECLNLRADLDAIKAIRNEETARAERAEADADSTRERALALANSLDEAQAELADEAIALRDMMSERDAAEAALTKERERLDWLAESWDNPLAINLHPSYGWSAASKNIREAIDAAMKEEAK